MKYCVNCGNAMNDTDIICQNCGANNAPAQPEETTKKLPDLKKIPPKFIGIGAVAVVAVIALIIIISAIFGGAGYNKAIDNLIDVSMYGKLDKLEDLAPAEFWDMVKDETDLSVKKFVEELEDSDFVEEMLDSMEEEFGKNVKVEVGKKITLSVLNSFAVNVNCVSYRGPRLAVLGLLVLISVVFNA